MLKNRTLSHTRQAQIPQILHKLANLTDAQPQQIQRILRKYPKDKQGFYSKAELLAAYHQLKPQLQLNTQQTKQLLLHIQTNKTRSISGVTPVTVFTKPFPCPGKCIFCPNDVRMPKSYLSAEPGAQRAMRNKFDPYAQTYNRLVAFQKNGHPTSKIELIILGGTWTAYTKDYQHWFIKRCFDALNDFNFTQLNQPIDHHNDLPFAENLLVNIDGSNIKHSYNRVVSLALLPKRNQADTETATIEQVISVQKQNELALARCVGLVIETRPDEIDEQTVIELRTLGATKIQIGFQSLNDDVLKKNHRGHNVATTRQAVKLIRQAGFKIQAHWMPNLYGSNPHLDQKDFYKLFHDLDFKPDELKIYPCSLIATAELMAYHKAGLWEPYTHEQLVDVLSFALQHTPAYCRLSRVIRDISSDDIVTGNKTTNLREVVQYQLAKQKIPLADIRAREIRDQQYQNHAIKLHVVRYTTSVSTEYFIQCILKLDSHKPRHAPIAAFLRLSIPMQTNYIKELHNAAIIRELHVYGPSNPVGNLAGDKTQHRGLGKRLIRHATKLAQKQGLQKISVISAVGTREYYRKQGFTDGQLYQHKLIQ